MEINEECKYPSTKDRQVRMECHLRGLGEWRELPNEECNEWNKWGTNQWGEVEGRMECVQTNKCQQMRIPGEVLQWTEWPLLHYRIHDLQRYLKRLYPELTWERPMKRSVAARPERMHQMRQEEKLGTAEVTNGTRMDNLPKWDEAPLSGEEQVSRM